MSLSLWWALATIDKQPLDAFQLQAVRERATVGHAARQFVPEAAAAAAVIKK